MIVDLQGVGNVLTDPQIHCEVDRHKFGRGNLGRQGVLLFFNTHECNRHCRDLGLVNPRYTVSLPEDMRQLIPDVVATYSMPDEAKIHGLCDLCRKTF